MPILAPVRKHWIHSRRKLKKIRTEKSPKSRRMPRPTIIQNSWLARKSLAWANGRAANGVMGDLDGSGPRVLRTLRVRIGPGALAARVYLICVFILTVIRVRDDFLERGCSGVGTNLLICPWTNGTRGAGQHGQINKFVPTEHASQ